MELLTGKLNKLYTKYLFTALGSTIIISVYSSVDMIAVGHYCGPDGSAAISCINPLWSIMISVGLLFGIGGSVWMSNRKGAGDSNDGNRYFTVSIISSVICAVVIMCFYIFCMRPLLTLFGAVGNILELSASYAKWIAVAVPAFTVGNTLSAFIRNDGSPGLCTAAILTGGIINSVCDFLFVFGFNMGTEGAGLATALGQTVSFLILCSYFFSKRCTLRLVKPKKLVNIIRRIIGTGFAPCIIDLSFGVTVILFNKQIMRYASSAELAVFGTVSTIALLFQSLFYGVGQALQPIASGNFGALKIQRVIKTLKMSVATAVIMSILFFGLSESIPTALLRIYMKVSPEVMAIGPNIFRIYAVSFLFMGINVVATYYLQSVLRSVSSTVISLMRGFVLCAVFLLLLPGMFGFNSIWLTMPLTEFIVFIYSVTAILLSNKKLKRMQ